MRVERCTSPDCRRPFQVNEFDGKESGGNEPGVIICPHCGHEEGGIDTGIYLVHALSEQEEADFNMQNPLESEDSKKRAI